MIFECVHEENEKYLFLRLKRSERVSKLKHLNLKQCYQIGVAKPSVISPQVLMIMGMKLANPG